MISLIFICGRNYETNYINFIGANAYIWYGTKSRASFC